VSSWELDDAERRNAEHPRRFFIPPAELRGSLAPGAVVKLLFVGPTGVERMWVEVTDARDGRYTGTLLNQPVELEGLHAGEVIAFEPRHVAAYDYSAEELGYDPDGEGYLPARVRDEDVRPLRARLGPEGVWILSDGGWAEFDERPDTIAGLSLGYLTDLWPELDGPFRDGSDGEEWIWDEAAGAYRREG